MLSLDVIDGMDGIAYVQPNDEEYLDTTLATDDAQQML